MPLKKQDKTEEPAKLSLDDCQNLAKKAAEICPFCAIQFGGYCVIREDGGLSHLDIMFSYEAGQSAVCEATEMLAPYFKTNPPMIAVEWQDKELETSLKANRDYFEQHPERFSKQRGLSLNQYILCAIEWLNWIDERSFDREKISMEVVEKGYEDGKNVKELFDPFEIEEVEE